MEYIITGICYFIYNITLLQICLQQFIVNHVTVHYCQGIFFPSIFLEKNWNFLNLKSDLSNKKNKNIR